MVYMRYMLYRGMCAFIPGAAVASAGFRLKSLVAAFFGVMTCPSPTF